MDGSIRFFDYSKTVNERFILNIIRDHGEYVLHATESVLAPEGSESSLTP